MSVSITYVSSAGNTYDLKTDGLKIKEANFHNYAWSLDTTERQYGVRINRFNKSPITYSTTLAFIGTYTERKEQIEALHADFETDIISETPGRIYWGKDYIDCYIISSSTAPDDKNIRTENEVEIYCPYPFWIEEYTYNISALETTTTAIDTDKGYTDTRYSYDTGYSYSSVDTIKHITLEDFYGLASYKLIASGPTDYVSITINDVVRTVNYPVNEGEYLTIDTRPNIDTDKRIFLTGTDGTTTNVFDYRAAGTGIFTKIEPGILTIDYSRAYPIEITLYVERSEPRNG